MLRITFIVCCVLMSCRGQYFPDFNFTISSKHNDTGHWLADVHLDHLDKLPWDVYLTHTTVTFNDTKSVHIDAKIIAPVTVTDTPASTGPQDRRTRQKHPFDLGYELLPGFGYYKTHTELKIWFDALEICQQEGSHLLILNSDEEVHQVGKFIQKHNVPYSIVSIGIHDRYKEGNWITIFDDPLHSTGFSQWRRGEPNGNTKENCGYFMYNSSTFYGLSDHFCNYQSEFVCEKEI